MSGATLGQGIKRQLRPTSDCRCAAQMVAEWLPI
jgi:hypothetical protein